jgi:SPP1 family predicted phage head-tail adaptor
MAMRAGKLDRRIVIQALGVVRDGLGQPVETWSPAYTRFAEVQSVSGGEAFGDQQREAKATKTFRIRHIAGLAPKTHRIAFDGEAYDIDTIEELGRREGLLVTAHAYEVETGDE